MVPLYESGLPCDDDEVWETPSCPTCDSPDYVEQLDDDWNIWGCIKCGGQFTAPIDETVLSESPDEDDADEIWAAYVRGEFTSGDKRIGAINTGGGDIASSVVVEPKFGEIINDTEEF